MNSLVLDFEAPERVLPDRDRGGETYDPVLDRDRLNRQARAVFDCIRGGGWWTLREISEATGEPEASISARLRDFRKHGWTVHRERRKPLGGTWMYSLELPR